MKLLILRKKIGLGLVTMLLPFCLFASGAPKPSSLDNPLAMTLLVIIIVLALIIGLLGYVVTGAAGYFTKKDDENKTSVANRILPVFIGLFSISSLFAQDVEPAAKGHNVSGLDSGTFFMLMSVIAIEVIVIFALLYFLQRFIAKEKLSLAPALLVAVPKENRFKRWWKKMNSFRSLKEEADIDLGHSYDGIRELDNRLPPWWLYGFYLTIFVAVVYLWRYHVSHSAPSSIEEYTTAVQKAEEDKQAYLAKAANQVDENSVVMLDDAGVSSGKAIFTTNCAPCHGPDGRGVVGPNLTDDYWLHGGSLKDVFKTIKYGVQEKGMKSWKDDLSPVQLAQLASFIRSIHGAKVENPKEPQGELYQEEKATDTTGKGNAVVKP